MIRNEYEKKNWAEILLGTILVFSAFLNFWNVWNQGYSNVYYAAAVRSMLENPGIAFFNSFDAAGFVTIDKPPVGLWVQCASAVIFGFSGWALVLPQALAGVGSVALVYAIISRPFGKPAGLVSAFALAVTPIFVAVSRNGTMDGILIFVLLLALWTALKAFREQSFPLLLGSVVLIGIGFNIKMIQAFIVVPAVLVICLFGSRGGSWKKQVLHLGIAVLLLVVVSLSWAVAVDLIPADERPYIGGSGDNTVLGLIVNYNGLHRLENGMGGAGGPGGAPSGPGGPTGSGSMPDGQDRTSFGDTMMQNRTADRTGTWNTAPSGMTAPPGQQGQGSIGQLPDPTGQSGTPGSQSGPGGMTWRTGGMGGRMDNSGTPGPLRLFNAGLAGQISWLLPFALIGLLSWWRRPAILSLNGLEDAGLFSERGLVLLAAGLWLLPGLMYFSFTTGFWHTYYIATIAPPLAMLVGIGSLGLYDAYRSGSPAGWLLVGAVLITGLIQVVFLSYSEPWSSLLLVIVLSGTVFFTIVLAALRLLNTAGSGNYFRGVAAAAIAILFLATIVWAFTPLVYGDGGNLPVAGPQQNRGGGSMGDVFSGTGDSTSQLGRYLLSHRTSETWIVAVPSSMGEGANLIIETGEPVMSLGGFSGSDRILTMDSLKNLIDTGKIRYFLGSGSSGGGGMGGGNSEIFTWVSEHCTEVPAEDWGGSSGYVSPWNTGPFSGNTTGWESPGSGTSFTGNRSGSGTAHNTQPASGNMTPAFPGSGSTAIRNGGMGGANTLYDCAGYTGQTIV